MKRRSFLKSLAGVVGAAVVGAKIKLAPAATPAPIAPIAPAATSYAAAPRGLAYLINNDTGCFQMLSRVSYPELSAPTPDAHGGALTLGDVQRMKRALRKGRR